VTTAWRRALLAACLAASGAGLLASRGPLRFTWTNDGLEAVFPGLIVAMAVASALGMALAMVPAARPATRLILGVAALTLGARAADRGVYRLEVSSVGLAERALSGSSALAWPEVVGVYSEQDRIRVRGKPDVTLQIATSLLRPEDRATLERTLSRRVRESQVPRPSLP